MYYFTGVFVRMSVVVILSSLRSFPLSRMKWERGKIINIDFLLMDMRSSARCQIKDQVYVRPVYVILSNLSQIYYEFTIVSASLFNLFHRMQHYIHLNFRLVVKYREEILLFLELSICSFQKFHIFVLQSD